MMTARKMGTMPKRISYFLLQLFGVASLVLLLSAIQVSPASAAKGGKWILAETKIIPASGSGKIGSTSITVTKTSISYTDVRKGEYLSMEDMINEKKSSYAITFTHKLSKVPDVLTPGQVVTITDKATVKVSGDLPSGELGGHIRFHIYGTDPASPKKPLVLWKSGKNIEDFKFLWKPGQPTTLSKSFTFVVPELVPSGKIWLNITRGAIGIKRVYRAGVEKVTQADCAKSGELTKYIKALREHKKILSSIDKEIDRLLAGPAPDHQTLVNFGKKALSVGTAYYKTLKSFQRAETRRGLFEELDLLTTNSAMLIKFTIKYRKLAKAPIKPVDEETITSISRSISKAGLDLVKRQAAARLKSEGLQDILTSESWSEAVEKSAYHADRKVQEYLKRETKKIFGLAFYDAASAKRALRLKMRREVRRQVAKLLVKVTSNEIIIELVAGPIIRWIGRELIPKLREALRPKGNLKNRVDRSVETLRTARNDLNKLTCDSKLRDVRQTLRKANGAVLATKYLDRDLRKANNAILLTKLADTRGYLERTIRITKKRFLLHKNDYEEDLSTIVTWVARDLNSLKEAIPDGQKNK